MDVFYKEGPVDYPNYAFNYTCWWCWIDDPALMQSAYAAGFLPWSGDPTAATVQFYMARSLRVDISSFSLDKKRRYEFRRWQQKPLQRELLAKSEFLERHGEQAESLAMRWMEARLGQPYLSVARFSYILQMPFLQDCLCWYNEDELVAFALIVRLREAAHYWFVFYSPTVAKPGNGACSDGAAFLLDFISWCKATDLRHAYLGTAYRHNSLYKFRGMEGAEYWNGASWSNDRDSLLRAVQADPDK